LVELLVTLGRLPNFSASVSSSENGVSNTTYITEYLRRLRAVIHVKDFKHYLDMPSAQ
jgi:hypothetical protein